MNISNIAISMRFWISTMDLCLVLRERIMHILDHVLVYYVNIYQYIWIMRIYNFSGCIIRMKMESTFLVFLIAISTGLVNGVCPSVCSCSSSSVNCYYKSLVQIPDELPNDTVHLWVHTIYIYLITYMGLSILSHGLFKHSHIKTSASALV